MLPSPEGGRTTSEVGYFQCEVTTYADWLLEGFLASDEPSRLRKPRWRTMSEALADLIPVAPVSRYGCVPIGDWTLLLDNGPGGTDVGVLPRYAARELRTRAIRAVSTGDDVTYPARIMEVYDVDGDASSMRRSIVAANDGGRWVFETYGEPFDFEDLEAYDQRIKAKRFSEQML